MTGCLSSMLVQDTKKKQNKHTSLKAFTALCVVQREMKDGLYWVSGENEKKSKKVNTQLTQWALGQHYIKLNTRLKLAD